MLAIYFYRTTRDEPEDVGLPSIEEHWTDGGWLSVLRNSDIRTIAAMYFFLKMNRFTLLLWLPLYLVQTVHYSDGLANSTSALFELFGFVGAVAATYVSNRYFQAADIQWR